ncbi:hypothetical protein [Thiobacillus sp.]|uniref:hypothetical protein n=1 Tax=Thiobacillus sp. TaxID=924 RepID=UPI001792A4E6|nr:hypothetical protein [Thiobacillus sp.]MBC2731660.1 hypothetical protein [Thiobacillus sp.]MBC2740399.1 hypothetical protein [Thiobacillus sp.]MBC2759193.1 hypothetical protein [Thiobacillus sp.]
MSLHRTAILLLTALVSLFSGHAHATPEADFWRWFKMNDAALFDFERDQERTFDRLAAAMHKVHPSLTFEFGPKDHGHRDFVISADGIREAFPKVESLFASAPRLAKWKVIKFRPRREPFDIKYGGISVKADTVSVMLRPEIDKIGLTVLIPGYTEASREAYMGIAFLMLDQALGEYDVETRVGQIEVAAPGDNSAKAVSLMQLPHAFDALFASRR